MSWTLSFEQMNLLSCQRRHTRDSFSFNIIKWQHNHADVQFLRAFLYDFSCQRANPHKPTFPNVPTMLGCQRKESLDGLTKVKKKTKIKKSFSMKNYKLRITPRHSSLRCLVLVSKSYSHAATNKEPTTTGSDMQWRRINKNKERGEHEMRKKKYVFIQQCLNSRWQTTVYQRHAKPRLLKAQQNALQHR